MRTIKIFIAGLLFMAVCSCSVQNGLNSTKGLKTPSPKAIEFDSNGLIARQ